MQRQQWQESWLFLWQAVQETQIHRQKQQRQRLRARRQRTHRKKLTLPAIPIKSACCRGCSGNADSQTEAAKTEAESAQAEDTSKEADASGDSYKIGVLQLTQHTALDKVNEGFVAAIEESGIDAELDQQNASGDQSACQTIAQMLVGS